MKFLKDILLYGVCILVVGYTVFSLYQGIKPLKTYEFKSIEIETPIVKRGQSVVFWVDFCKFTDNSVTSSRVLRKKDFTYISAAPVIITLSPSGCRKVKTSTLIPEEAPTGTYLVESTQVVKFNKREVVTKYVTGEFEVVE